MKMNRRNVLRLFGLAGASYGAASLASASSVRADSPIIPRRLVFFYTEHGTLKQFNDDGSLKPFWAPTVNGAPDASTIQTPWSTSSFTLSDMHGPLVPYQNDILMLDGLDMASVGVDPTPGANGHINGATHAMTGTNRQTSSLAGGISIDQLIATTLNSPSPITVLPSLEAYIDTRGHWGGVSGQAAPLYASAGEPLPMSSDAPAIYQRMFPNGAQGANQDKAKAQKALALQTSSIEAAYARYKTVSSRTSSLDQARLDAHAQALRDLEQRLALAANTSCTPPDDSLVAGELVSGDNGATDEAAYKTNADILMRLVQSALACDLTRVATVYAPTAPDAVFGYTSVGGTTDFHDMIHKTNGANAPLGADPTAIGIVKAYQSYNASLFVSLLDLLAAIPEADGTTLLDNTLVVWCGELAGGDHSVDRIPYVLAGGMGGAVKPGRYIRYPRVPNSNWPSYSAGPGHNDLFVALANMMGVPITTFGNPDVCKGPLAGLI